MLFHIKQQGVTNDNTGDHRNLNSLATGLELGYVWKLYRGLYIAARIGALYYLKSPQASDNKPIRIGDRDYGQWASQGVRHLSHPDAEARGWAVLETIRLRLYSLGMPRGNPAVKLAITVDSEIHAKVLIAAEADGTSVSAWITEAARRALLVRDGLLAVAEWEAEHGPLTRAEIAAARARLGRGATKRRRASR